MTEPGEGGRLTADELSRLRHDLRTPFNGIIGYTEMLLETAEEEGLPGLAEELTGLVGSARGLLGQVNAALAAGLEVGPGELRALAESVAAQAGPLERHARSLLDRADGELAACRPDLAKLHAATAELARIGGALLVARAAPAAAAETCPVAAHAPVAAPASPGGVVLVVDDIETNRDLLCRRLEREGYTPRAAAGGREALAALREGEHDLILLDVMMPELDGYEVLRQVKADPRLRDLPVIMISAVDELASVVRCIEMGAEDYLPKPFDPVLLRARVGACLEKKRLRDKELEYLRGVEALQEAATAVEAGAFRPEALAGVAARADALGHLARVFQRMADEVKARERRLKTEVEHLRVEVDLTSLDSGRTARHVEEIIATPFFNTLEEKLATLRRRRAGPGTVTAPP